MRDTSHIETLRTLIQPLIFCLKLPSLARPEKGYPGPNFINHQVLLPKSFLILSPKIASSKVNLFFGFLWGPAPAV